jgi:hypothetical protein
MDYVCTELEDLEHKADKGKLSLSDVQLAETLSNIKKNLLKMDEMTGEVEYSGAYPYADGIGGGMRSYRMDGGSYGSYAGRRNARRDSMGRYSRNGGYSGDFRAELEDLIEDAPNEHIKRKMRDLMQEM